MLDEAAEVLRRQLAQCGMFADFYIARAWDRQPPGQAVDYRYLEQARDMVRLCAEIATALARVKGEVRQRIVVEHVEASAAPALIGETRIAGIIANDAGRGEGVDSEKQLDVVPAHDATTS